MYVSVSVCDCVHVCMCECVLVNVQMHKSGRKSESQGKEGGKRETRRQWRGGEERERSVCL